MANQRSFLRAIRALTRGDVLRWVSITDVANQLGIVQEEAEHTAQRLYGRGLVWLGGIHSITLTEAGRQHLRR